MRQAHLSHLPQVAKAAAREVPELAQKLVLRPGTSTYLAFSTAARGMRAEAQTQKEALDQFDAAVERGTGARHAHVGARAELEEVGDEIVQIVRVMDGLNRYRFLNDSERLATWQRQQRDRVAEDRSAQARPRRGAASRR